MIKTTLEKFWNIADGEVANRCETLSVLIERAKEDGRQQESEKNRGKLRGILDGLESLGMLTQQNVKELYIHYVEKDRTGERQKKESRHGNPDCVNDQDTGSCWGTITTLEKINEAIQQRGRFKSAIQFCGILNDWNGKQYQFFKDVDTEDNYFVEIK